MLTVTKMESKTPEIYGNIEDKHIEMWKYKRIMKKLESSKG